MTETLQPPPAASGPPPQPSRLVRRPDEKVLAGVCAAFARATDTDPLLWRIGIAVLSLFGGTGIALYVLGWLLVPRLGAGPTAVERALRRPDANVGTVVLLAIGAVVLLAVLDNGPGAGAVLVLGGIAYLVFRERRDSGAEPAAGAYSPPLVMHGPDPAPATAHPHDVTSSLVDQAPYESGLTAPLGYGAGYGGGGGYGGGSYETSPFAAWDAVPPPPKVQRRKSRLGLMTLSAAAVLAGGLLTLRAAGFEEVTFARILAAVLVVLGTGMVVGTWIGRARWLMLPALLVAALLVPAAVLPATPGFGGGVGAQTWTPTTNAHTEFALGAGEATLDLQQLDPEELTDPLSVDLGFGELLVLVPDGMRVQVSADVGVGEILTRDRDGNMRSLREDSGDVRVDEEFSVGDRGDPVVELDLQVGAGQIEVRRVAA